MHRILFEIGPFTVYSYGLMVSAAFILSVFFIMRDCRRRGISGNRMLDCLLAVLAGGLIGGRLLFVAVHPQEYLTDPVRMLMLQEGGLAFQGAFIGGLAAGIICAKAKAIPVLKGMDIIAPYIAMGQAIGRIGCFLNGCCYGRPAEGAFTVTFPGETVSRVPVQLYSSVSLFIICFALLVIRKRNSTDGAVFAGYLLIYGIYRMLIEFLRADNPAVLAGFTLPQLIGAGMAAAGLLMWMFLKTKGGRL